MEDKLAAEEDSEVVANADDKDKYVDEGIVAEAEAVQGGCKADVTAGEEELLLECEQTFECSSKQLVL